MLRIASACAIGIFLSFVMPQIVGDDYASRKAARVAAPFLGALYHADTRDSKITVLLIDDQALIDAGTTWPPPYDYYADVLENVANYAPRAVFIDLIFSSARAENVQRLVDAINKLKSKKTKVYLAASLDEHGKLSVRHELQISAARTVAVEYDPDEVDHVVWEYPTTNFGDHKEHPEERRETQAERPRSAALAIYEDLFGEIKDKREPLALTWGLAPVTDGLEWTLAPAKSQLHAASGEAAHAHNAAEKPSLYCNENQSTVPLIVQTMLHAAIPDHGKPACVFHHTLYQRELLYPDETLSARHHQMFDERIVMIGTAFDYSNDIVVSPIQGRIPDIYLHAMALDNLISSKGEYIPAVKFEPTPDWPHVRAFFLLLTGLIGVAAVMLIKENLLEKWEHAYHARCVARARARATTVHTAREQRFYRVQDKLLDAARCIGLKAGEIVVSVLLVGIVFVAGQKFFHVAYLSAMEVTLYALVSEWLEWNTKLVGWFNKSEETS
ncbi:CHASE2 domain-containing protein [Candidatus Burkholderia verschuerenii]|uniref:CHASE2 domain-containing protein n=1 Tax=Candidatus Burkholderia verschuerenii TaxID=242163 RepID=UPI00067BB0AE|nr:CHASE2 domain-containing protein [Candidatus Burkholderia verschuerenii]